MTNLFFILVTLIILSIPTRADNFDVKETYIKLCSPCHAKNGSGDTKSGKIVGTKDFRDPKLLDGIKENTGSKIIKEGIKDDSGNDRMRPFNTKLTDKEIIALFEYVRGFKTNNSTNLKK